MLFQARNDDLYVNTVFGLILGNKKVKFIS